MIKPLRFLSLGGGVQSSVMLMMAIHGDIDRPDHVLFADTGWEKKATMDHIEWLEMQCTQAGLPFLRVTAGNIRDDMLIARTASSGGYVKAADRVGRAGRFATMPLFVDTGKGIEGRITRQCTSEYKLVPLRAKQRELLGYGPRQRIPMGSSEVWIGISTDEARRAAPSTSVWVDNIYPLIDPLKMSRADCQSWWDAHYPDRRLIKSACLGCPHRSDLDWAAIKQGDSAEWNEIVEFDRAIRMCTGLQGKAYIHRSLTPIDQVPLGEGQMNLDLDDMLYCAGGCGL